MVIIFEEVQLFIKQLEKPTANKVIRLIEALEKFGYLLTMPYSKAIDTNLFELRINGKIAVRIIYTFKQGNILLFYGFIKKSQKIPRKELYAIHKRWRNLQD